MTEFNKVINVVVILLYPKEQWQSNVILLLVLQVKSNRFDRIRSCYKYNADFL